MTQEPPRSVAHAARENTPPRPPRDHREANTAPDGTPAQPGPAKPAETISALRTRIRAAINDPGAALPRERDSDGFPETVANWGARAVLATVIPTVRQQAIRDLEAGQIAAKELAAAGCETRHIVDLRDDGWTIRHPLSCRPGLFDCPVNRAAERDLTEPPEQRGAYACLADDDGCFRIGDPIARGDQ